MNLTEKQLEQCRKDFEAWDIKLYDPYAAYFANKICFYDDEPDKWNRAISFYAAWRPVPTVDEISKLIRSASMEYPNAVSKDVADTCSYALHHAFEGQE